MLATLADNLPPGSQLVLAGRGEPPLGLARLRSQGRILDIGADDLRLGVPEARELLAAAGVHLSEPELAGLVARTEGWAAGLYFAAIAGNAGAFPLSGEGGFDGDDRLLTDYIRSEFLARLPEDDVRFLTRTSVLDELCGPLCDATLERTGSAAVLERMEASNLLLIPQDRQRRWYRYHHLFQVMLRHELERREPAACPVLTRRASRWCEANGLIDSAVRYAQVAGDARRVGRVLLRHGMRLYALGRAATLRRWFEWLAGHGPVEGGVAVLGAWLSLLSGRASDAERWTAIAGAAPQDAELPDGSPAKAWLLTLHAATARDANQMRSDAERGYAAAVPGKPVASDRRIDPGHSGTPPGQPGRRGPAPGRNRRTRSRPQRPGRSQPRPGHPGDHRDPARPVAARPDPGRTGTVSDPGGASARLRVKRAGPRGPVPDRGPRRRPLDRPRRNLGRPSAPCRSSPAALPTWRSRHALSLRTPT